MEINAYLQRGRDAVEDGELELAAKYFNSVLSEAPDHPEALEGLQSIKVADAKRGWGPVARWAVFTWCRCSMLLGKYEGAFPKLRILHASNPTSQLFAEALGAAAIQQGEHKEAEDAYRSVLRLEPNRLSALNGLGNALQRQDKTAEAIKCYQKIQQMRPKDDKLDHLLRDLMAKEYARTGVPEDIKAARREIEKEKSKRIRVPGTPDFTERLEKLAEHCETNPEDLDARVQMAAHLRRGGQPRLVQEVLTGLLDEHPEHWEGRLEQAALWREVGEVDLAVTLYEQLVREAPDDEELHCVWLEATLDLAHREGVPDSDPQTMRIREDLFARRRKLWESHLVDHPEDLDTRAKLAKTLLGHRDVTDAIEHTQRLLQSPSWTAPGFLLLGRCFRAQGKHELATEQFQKSIDSAKNKGYTHIPSEDLKAAHYYLGVTLEEMGAIDEARDAYGAVYAADIGYRDISIRYERVAHGGSSQAAEPNGMD